MSKPENTAPKINLAEVMEVFPHAVIIIGSGGRIRFVNLAAQSFFSSSESVLLSRNLAYFFPEDSPLVALVSQIMHNGNSINEYQMELTSHRLERVDVVDVYAVPLIETPDQVLLMIQQRNMAQKIERQIAQRGIARSVSGMASILAHEIKNPLSGIRGAAQLLEAGLSDEDKALTRLICTETDRICRLVDQMEEFGDPRLDLFTDVNIHSVLEHVKKVAENGCARHVRFMEEYDPSLPQITGDHDRLVQAFFNLVKNAAESIHQEKKDGTIIIRSAYRPGMRLAPAGTQARVSLPIEIQVQDNGGGISDDLRAHLFDPFISSKPGGKGLGLALVAKIVADHGGTIEYDSNPDRTLFRVLLPARQ